MKPFPHLYSVTGWAAAQLPVELHSPGLTPINSAPPVEFDGPGTMWSPETLLVSAVCDCFILTFRAIAKASHLDWTSVLCEGNGTVARSDGVTRFTAIELRVRLQIPVASETDKARKLLEKAEKSCLVTNSLNVVPAIRVEVAADQAA